MSEWVRIAVVDNRFDDAKERTAAINARADWPAPVSAEIFTNADDLFDAYDVEGKFFDIILTDVYMPQRGEDPREEGLPEKGAIRIQEWLKEKRAIDQDFKYVQLIWISTRSDVSTFIHKYINADNYSWLRWISQHNKSSFFTVDFIMEVERAIHMALPGLSDDEFPSDFIVEAPAMKKAVTTARLSAKTDSNVLITGETGTGKEVIARYIHESSRRSGQVFIPLNCTALTESLAEAELFGSLKGAFTGAYTDRKGLFEAADKGTLFLDEIGDMSHNLQAKILRVIEERKFSPVGGSAATKTTNFRLITATWRNLQSEILAGNFRQDLFYRLAVFTIEVPPLRERPEDIEPLAKHFLRKYGLAANKAPLPISEEVVDCLRRYSWPGNVRELSNIIERAVGLAAINEKISFDHLPDYLRPESVSHDSVSPLSDPEQQCYQALKDQHFNIAKAAAVLGRSRSALHKYLNSRDKNDSLHHPMLNRLYEEGRASVEKRRQRARASVKRVSYKFEDEF